MIITTMTNTVRGDGENFSESSLIKQLVQKILANLLVGLQLFNCTYRYWRGKIWQIEHHYSPNLPKFSHLQIFPHTV